MRTFLFSSHNEDRLYHPASSISPLSPVVPLINSRQSTGPRRRPFGETFAGSPTAGACRQPRVVASAFLKSRLALQCGVHLLLAVTSDGRHRGE